MTSRGAAGDGAALEPAPRAERAPPARRWSIVRLLLGVLLLAASLLGLLLRLTVRDRWPYISAAYYALPLPVAAAAALTAAALLRNRRRAGTAALAAGLVGIAWWGGVHWRFHAPRSSDDALRVVFWNVNRGYAGWDAIRDEARAFDADVIGLVEAGPLREMRDYWPQAFPGRTAVSLRGGMALAVRGEIVSQKLFSLDYRATANRLEVRCRGREWVVWLIDIYSDPLMDRGPPLEWLANLVAADASRPMLVMGDFNTPADSVHLAGMRKRLRNAFETAGNGYAATWPLPLPVLTLDQMWAAPPLDVLSCRHAWTGLSDHRPVVATFFPRDS